MTSPERTVMPRQARIVIPGYLYHVTQRGNYKQDIFEEDKDRIIYLKLVQEYSEAYAADIYAYCLMNNHVHFIVRPRAKESLARTFCVAHQRYSLYFHQKRQTKGHLWQERFYSCVLHGSHLPKAIRYVERNPVRACMVRNPWDHTWSSAKAHLGLEYKIIKLADIKEHLTVPSWKEFLLSEETPEDLNQIRKMTLRNSAVGPIEFIQALEQKLQRKLLPGPTGRPRKIRDRD